MQHLHNMDVLPTQFLTLLHNEYVPRVFELYARSREILSNRRIPQFYCRWKTLYGFHVKTVVQIVEEATYDSVLEAAVSKSEYLNKSQQNYLLSEKHRAHHLPFAIAILYVAYADGRSTETLFREYCQAQTDMQHRLIEMEKLCTVEKAQTHLLTVEIQQLRRRISMLEGETAAREPPVIFKTVTRNRKPKAN